MNVATFTRPQRRPSFRSREEEDLHRSINLIFLFRCDVPSLSAAALKIFAAVPSPFDTALIARYEHVAMAYHIASLLLEILSLLVHLLLLL